MSSQPTTEPTRAVQVGGTTFGAGNPFVLIAGPCVIENDRHPFEMAQRLSQLTRNLGVPYIFKASFDKANRTSRESFRGPGLRAGLQILAEIRERFEVPVTTDVHEPHQAEAVAEVVDLLQIPAFLCRQTDLIVACARTGKPVNIKKGQFLAPWDAVHALDKAAASGNCNLLITERGTSFGYNNLVVDFRGFPILRETGYPLVFDVTHSLQLPGGAGKWSAGQSRFIPELASAGVAAGVDGVFMEVHDEPARALSDGPNSCPLDQLASILHRLKAIEKAIGETA
ncbi:MAG: 3-deoxy-8-phosphooctulonate synthase [Acidobacteriota bacterium]